MDLGREGGLTARGKEDVVHIDGKQRQEPVCSGRGDLR